MTDRAAFLADRKKGVGGSDIASLFGVGWGCRRRLFYDKTSHVPDYPREENLLMALGNVLEPWFAERYAKETGRGVTVEDDPMINDAVPNLRVNVDRGTINEPWPQEWIEDPDGPAPKADGNEVLDWVLKHKGILEIKSVGRSAFFKYKREGLPQDYILQLQAGMLASGLSFGSFAIGCRDNGELHYWDVERSEALCAEIAAEVPKFWELVEEFKNLIVVGTTHQANALAPPRLAPDDRRCQSCEFRATCQGSALISIAPASDYTPDESLRPLVQEFIERRALAKQANDLLDETKEELKSELGDRGMVSSGGAKILYYEIEKKAFTVAAHKERTLRVYEVKK